MRISPTLLAPLLTAAVASAQQSISFDIDQNASAWTWSGDTSLGPLEGNPNQDFELAGTFQMKLTAGALPISEGEFVGGGVATVVPGIHAKIPNPVPNFPPLAEIDITNLTLEFTAPTFPIDAAGAFTANTTVTILTGTLTVTPLVGDVTVTDLAGASAGPNPITGTLLQSGMTLDLASSQAGTFSFTDSGSGISATVDIVGDLVGDFTCPPPTNYCSSNANSTNMPGLIGSSGSTRLQDNAFTLSASQLPVGKFGYFLFSDTQGFVPLFGGSQGNLCLGGSIVRFSKDVLTTAGNGTVTFTPDLDNLPSMSVFHPGDTQNFQLWYRDNNPGQTSNTTDGLEVVFCP